MACRICACNSLVSSREQDKCKGCNHSIAETLLQMDNQRFTERKLSGYKFLTLWNLLPYFGAAEYGVPRSQTEWERLLPDAEKLAKAQLGAFPFVYPRTAELRSENLWIVPESGEVLLAHPTYNIHGCKQILSMDYLAELWVSGIERIPQD